MTVPDPLAAYRRATFNRKDGNGTGRKERGLATDGLTRFGGTTTFRPLTSEACRQSWSLRGDATASTTTTCINREY